MTTKQLSEVFDSYPKILKVNLTEDSYEIVKMDSKEMSADKGFSNNISRWLYDFAVTEQIHQDDAENYISMTDLGYLRKYFRDGNESFKLKYRRLIGGEFKAVVMEMVKSERYEDSRQLVYLFVRDVSA